MLSLAPHHASIRGLYVLLHAFLKSALHVCMWGTRWHNWMGHCAISRKVAGSLEFFIDIILRPHSGPKVHSASNGNENQKYFLGGGEWVGVCVMKAGV